MSELTLFKSGAALPDYLREADDFTKEIAGGAGGGKIISIEGGVWRMIVGGEEVAKNEDRAMNFVVVEAARSVGRIFYEGTYVKGQASTPACYSADGKVPAENAERPQAPSCATCKQNIAGSGQGDSRACRFVRRIAVVLEGDISGNVYRLQLPAKSLFGKPEGSKMPFDAYAKFLAGHGVPMSGVVTEARFDTSEAVPVLKFTAVRPLTREEMAQATAQRLSADAEEATKMVFTSKKPGTAAAAISFRAEQPAAESAEMPAPTKRAAKKPEPVIDVKDVDQIIHKWGTDDE